MVVTSGFYGFFLIATIKNILISPDNLFIVVIGYIFICLIFKLSILVSFDFDNINIWMGG